VVQTGIYVNTDAIGYAPLTVISLSLQLFRLDTTQGIDSQELQVTLNGAVVDKAKTTNSGFIVVYVRAPASPGKATVGAIFAGSEGYDPSLGAKSVEIVGTPITQPALY